MILALLLSALAGFVALSHEILWYRAYSFASAGSALAFPLMLGYYLLGIAAGSIAVRRWCRDPDTARKGLGQFALIANALGFLLVPAVGWLLTKGYGWKATLPFVGLVAAFLGSIFPLLSHSAVAPDARAGARVSYLYMANIVGSASGSFLTGFVLLDRWSIGTIGVFLGILGLAMAVLMRRSTWPVALGLGALLLAAGPRVFGSLYENLQYKHAPPAPFAHVVETKSGVITVTPDGRVYGGGIYDGVFNTDLSHDVNWIIRAYAFGALHPRPREVLMIGLASGSWATVVAENPAVERLTVVEINPGYARLVAKYPEVAGLLSNPKVRIEYDDGRRWMARNAHRRFDAIIANTTFHWRSHTSGLLSVEFLALVRSRLKEGGVYFFNATGSSRAQRTAAAFFPHAMRVMNCVLVSDAPVAFDEARFREILRGREAPVRLEFESRESILARTHGLEPITDDNMGTEWSEGRER